MTSQTPKQPDKENFQDGRELLLSTSDFVEYVSEKAANKVDEKIRVASQNRARNMAIILSVAGLIGLGTIASIAGLIVQNMIDASVIEATDGLQKELTHEIAYQQLVTLAFAISENDSTFERADKEGVMMILREISPSKTVRQRPGFDTYLETIVDVFYAGNLSGEIDEIDDLFESNLTANAGTILTLVNYYGEQIIGSPLSIDGQSVATVSRFRKYIDAAQNNELPEMALIWKILSEFKAGGSQKSNLMDELVFDIQFLNEIDSFNFYNYLRLYQMSTNWQRAETEKGNRIARLVNDLVTKYPELN